MNVSIKSRVIEGLFAAFITFLFFSINSGGSEIKITWIVMGLSVITSSFFLYPVKNKSLPLSLPFFTGLAFLVFQLLKVLFTGAHFLFSREGAPMLNQGVFEGAVFWFFEGAILISAFYLTRRKIMLSNLLKLFVTVSFFISLNQILPLLRNSYGYQLAGEQVFFHPIIYGFTPFSKFFFGQWCSMNWAGDFIAFGIFSGFGIIFYDIYRAVEKKDSVNWGAAGAVFFITAINTAVLFLLQSRGSLVFFSGSFLIYFAVLLFKWSFRYKGIFTVFFICGFLGFVFFAGNFKAAYKEVQTLSDEVKPETQRSWGVNLEGQKRTLRIFQTRPFFGVGHGNYKKISDQFADLGVDNTRSALAGFTPMSHYFQLMAEEGAGSFIYILFLFFWVLGSGWNILKTRSQFKVLTGLSLFCSILMVLGHASINDLMDHSGMLTLIFVTLGVLAGLFREDFDHGI